MITTFQGSVRFAETDVKTNPDPILSLEGLTKQYPTKKGPITVLEPSTLTVGVGELVSIVGPSGCGKSTLLHIVGGLTTPTGGRVLLDGKEVSDADADRGMVFQGYTLFPWLTVRQNVQFGPKQRGAKRACRSFSRCGRPAWLPRPLPEAAFGRHASARRDRARTR